MSTGAGRYLVEVVAIVVIILVLGWLMPERRNEKTCASIGGALTLGCN